MFANADPSKGYKGITCFIVERSNPGLKVSKKEDKVIYRLLINNEMGLRSTYTNEVTFQDCVVSKDAILGVYFNWQFSSIRKKESVIK